ncbi:MAG: restriction endonuclease subunit S [Paludibacteraceae bacterium]|nr:restriction endonuclease subunit S [Paludibacteraceae bacterium]
MNDALLSTNLIRIRLNLDLINADYFVLLFQSSQIKQQVKDLCKGTTRAFLNQTILSQISFPFPPLSEQQRIVQEIESRLSQATASETYIENALQQAEALRQSILKKAFSGELV